jgi:hypothetical protein
MVEKLLDDCRIWISILPAKQERSGLHYCFSHQNYVRELHGVLECRLESTYREENMMKIINNKRLRFDRAGIVLLAATLAPAVAFAQDDGQDPSDQPAVQVPQSLSARAPFFKQIVVDPDSQLFPGPADNVYQNLPGAGPANGAFAVIAGQGTLVTARFAAESQCAGGGSDFGWCGIRILIDGVESLPAPADFAFDSTNNGAEGTGSWEGHAMERHLCVRNPTGAVRIAPVQVQWRVFSTDGDVTPPEFRLDDTSLTIESSMATCG